jgi:hypothetical protein
MTLVIGKGACLIFLRNLHSEVGGRNQPPEEFYLLPSCFFASSFLIFPLYLFPEIFLNGDFYWGDTF